MTSRPYNLVPVAATGDRFSTFAPFVAAINSEGVVAFQGTMHGGATGVFETDGTSIETVVDTDAGPFDEICSHPDLDAQGSVCFYATRKAGGRGAYLVQNRCVSELAKSCGPLGPTMNASGVCAIRARDETGRESIVVSHGVGVIATAGREAAFAAFHGLAVINAAGAVAFRADTAAGVPGIYLHDGGELVTIAEVGTDIAALGAFPFLSEAGTVAYWAARRDGSSGVFLSRSGRTIAAASSEDGFESFRAVLLSKNDRPMLCATPVGGTLGIYSGPDPSRDCVLALGAKFLGSTVADFALNPVSINEAGQCVIRVQLSDSRQFIVRADPLSA